MNQLLLGTRGSELALTQTEMVKAALAAAWPDLSVSHEVIRTTGDLRPDLKLSEFNRGDRPTDKGVFTKELEEALQAGRVQAAVHSLKDVPTELGEGFEIIATLPRAPIEDVLISRTTGGLDALPAGALVATSSVRRARQLKALRPDLRVEDIRGNVPTRLKKLAESADLSAILLARAGLVRLSLFEPAHDCAGVPLHMTVLPADQFLPAASQGAVAIEAYRPTDALRRVFAGINHVPTFQCILAERHFLALLQAGCQTPVGVHTVISGDTISMHAIVFPEDATASPQRAQITAPMAAPQAAAAALHAALA